ncbi:MAG: methyltransferase domain-containing protein [Bacteroidota bacterium]|nr:methyltransferase domain-containing protein [Bacteroidota bacterium]
MKTIVQYARFFFYTALNWSPWLALFMLYHDIRGALKYGIKTFVPAKLSDLTIINADITKSSPYEAVNYFLLEKLLAAFRRLSPNTSIVDLGCGKGRVMVVAAYFGFTRITGIDFAKELCEEALSNMKKTQAVIPGISWNVIHANVLDYSISPEDTVFFMFNPFVEETLVAFLDQLEESRKRFQRKIYFLYASPEHALALQKRDYKIVFHQSLMNLEGLILAKD